MKRRVVEDTSSGDDLPLKRFFRVRVRSSVILEVLWAQPLLLHIKRSLLRWIGHLNMMPPRLNVLAMSYHEQTLGLTQSMLEKLNHYIPLSLVWECLGLSLRRPAGGGCMHVWKWPKTSNSNHRRRRFNVNVFRLTDSLDCYCICPANSCSHSAVFAGVLSIKPPVMGHLPCWCVHG